MQQRTPRASHAQLLLSIRFLCLIVALMMSQLIVHAATTPTDTASDDTTESETDSVITSTLRNETDQLENRTSIRDSIMDKILNQRYKKYERPDENKRTDVKVYMKVLAINSVDVRNMEYTTDVLLRQEWQDSRLSWTEINEFRTYNRNIVSPALKKRIWLPDLFFRNGKKGYVHKMTLPNYLMRLQPDGTLLYSQKITMRFSCQMDLHTFPMDTQTCEMNIGSYGYTVDQLRFYWPDADPIKLNDNLQISEFNPPSKESIRAFDCTEGSATATGAYTCLKAQFFLQRQLNSYLASTYVPNILIVTVSWLNFWVSIEAVPARITLGLLTLLGILTQSSSITQNLPRVSYIKAIDIWIIACIVFVISALIEFAMASMVARKKKADSWKRDVNNIVREELSRWCAACQRQQFEQLIGNSMGGGKAAHLSNTTADKNIPLINRPDLAGVDFEMLITIHMLDGPLSAAMSGDIGGGGGVPGGGSAVSGGGAAGVTNAGSTRSAAGPGGLPSLPTNKSSVRLINKKLSPPSSSESEIDCYSRFLFPACFILYNCFYWLYYLVLVKMPHQK